MFETTELGGLQVGQGRGEFFGSKGASSPDLPGEAAFAAGGFAVIDVKDTAVKWGTFHRGEVFPQERGIRLVPAKFNELFGGGWAGIGKKNRHGKNAQALGKLCAHV
jgi:hypothetical protein